MTPYRIQNLAYASILFLIGGYILYIGAAIVIPIIFAILFSVFLNPIEIKIFKYVKIKSVAIILSFLTIILPILLLTTLFSFQLMNIMESLPSIENSMTEGFNVLIQKVNGIVPFLQLNSENLLASEDSSLTGPIKIIGQGLLSTSSVLASSGLILIYTFLLLYYKLSFKNFIIYTFEKENRPDIKEALKDIKTTIQSYIGGLGLVVVILSVINSIGLYIIGIEHAIFWGTLAGFLAIIPYIGTLLGGLLPFIFALSTAEASWQPYAIGIFYLVVQQIEGNFITPKIIGDKVDINPLFAILSLVVFGSFWGIGGVILALPLISILKIILAQFTYTEPLSILMSSDVSNKKGIYRKLASAR